MAPARMSLRIFRRSPALALSAVLALAMGIGSTTTMFSIARLVIGQGSKLIAIGIAVGLVIAVGLSHALAAATEFFQPAGVLTYLAIAGALVATAAAALLRPVRRALALAPVDALRRE
jgi:ABC-type antimicrobial peptide transport system permease subunit